ncbi:hypothetical protein PAHAL_9G237100 [Panicum hallii]|uniref:TTF-type domain-containing protein n=1 Tax=Panicum hallii TaxID=206008 RepID=A0A2T8I2A4_9POAL|nr:hypothetical protein PAHAL_9G237100 [Panicum hallii]
MAAITAGADPIPVPSATNDPPPTQTNEIRAKPKRKTLFSYYQKARVEAQGQGQNDNDIVDQSPQLDENDSEDVPSPAPAKIRRLNSDASVLNVEHDPGLRCQIWEYPIDEQDQVRKIYIMHGPFQFKKDQYPYSGPEAHPRCFKAHWFKDFPWLEYSPAKDAAFCFPCYLFGKKPSGKVGSDVFTVKGFNT